mmetsp:Transcript_2983/g.5321  ORF Transcript_2983/g.5321 Transcript_2983/m.5321 type:complete len:220 (+) Transcript_2983:42-701(+)
MIIIEQDAMLRVLNTANMLLPCHPRDAVPWITPSTGGFMEANAALSKRPPSLDVKKRSNDDFCPDLLSLEADEDCISLSSCSSAASSSYSGRVGERRVSFASPLVTDVRTRPRTKDCDKRNLFYSSQETDRFRQLYREERSSLSSDDVLNVNLSSTDEEQPFARRRVSKISKVIVAHNENLETFYDFQESIASPEKGEASFDDVFFDNDSFWSGSITWY